MTLGNRIKTDSHFDWSRFMDNWPCPIQYNGRATDTRNARRFLHMRPAQIVSSDRVLYSLEEGLWSELSKEDLYAEIHQTDVLAVLDISKVKRMVEAVHAGCMTKARPFEWIDAPDGAPEPKDVVLFRNGVFDVNTGKLWPLDGKYFATATPMFDYKRDDECPLWLSALGKWLDPEFHPTVQEFFGYAMTPDNGLEHFLVLLGASRGGKSTMSRVLTDLVGSHHCASLTINDLSGPFGLQSTLDKRLIFVPDASDTDIRDRATALTRLKAITGNDEVSVNRKHLPLINACLRGRFVLVANRHPKFLDDSGALAARELVISFEKTIPMGERDKLFSHKLREELPGIANWALAGLARLRAQRHFTIGEKGREAVRIVAEGQAPALRFANECLIVTGRSEDFETVADLYRVYEDYAIAEGLRGGERRNRNDFAGDLESALRDQGVRRGGARVHDVGKPKVGKGRSVHGFRGVKIRDDAKVEPWEPA
jgi:P4 family phage/plasmid primase-like protien